MLASTDEVLNLLSSALDSSLIYPLSVSCSLLPVPVALSNDNKSVAGIPLHNYLEQMLVGVLLSDGTLVKKYVNGGSYLQLAQSIIHLPYLAHVHSLFVAANWCNTLVLIPKIAKVKGKGGTIKEYTYYSFTTKSLAVLNSVFFQWYTKNEAGRNIKHVPYNIHETLTAVGLAHWLMGDGGWTGNGIHLATNSFTVQDNLRLIKVLNDKFGLHATLHNTNRIFLPVASAKKFTELCLPYMEPSMMYKVDRSLSSPKLNSK